MSNREAVWKSVMSLRHDMKNPFQVRVTPRPMTWSSNPVGGAVRSHYYRFTVNRSSLGIELSGLRQNADIELLNSQGRVIQRSARKGLSNDLIYRNVARGTYYVRVVTRGAPTPYQLRMFAAPVNTVARRTQLVNQLQRLVNTERTKHGLQPLKVNAALATAAQRHSRDMAQNDYYSHTSLNGSMALTRVQASGYTPRLVGENIAAGQPSAPAVFRAWMNSPGHRANILNPEYREVGVGYHFLFRDFGNFNAQYYWTLKFGSSAS